MANAKKVTPVKKATAKARGRGFDAKYGVEKFQSYKADPDVLNIPGPLHALYDPDGNTTFDEHRVREIDKDGVFTGTVIVWTDKDQNVLWVVEGRGNVFDVREVNRRRRERGDDIVMIKFQPLDAPLDRAVEHVVLRNFHRKQPQPAHYAREIVRLFRLGKPWARIAEMLHLDENEHALRVRAALAYCNLAVIAAMEAGKVSYKKARRFGGKAIDGSEALGDAEQLALLADMTAEGAKSAKPRAVSRAVREKLAETLANGGAKHLKGPELTLARALAAYERRLNGEAGALAPWPEVAAIVDEVLTEKDA